jgi:FlaA1/EpsC-like NDP-sugar epimerase/lipopolysaccharide/colanic/teichoic acid biosynthesis glycosyltransferase
MAEGIMIKRATDILGAVLVLVALSPVLLVIVLAIKVGSPGPVLHATVRVGKGGRLFRLYKLRSASPAIAGSHLRVTKIGRLMRRLRLDDAPQFVNVLLGDMSLVGPRAETPSIVERYTTEQREILRVRPGLTGPSQLAGLDDRNRSPLGVDPLQYHVTHIVPQNIQEDLAYVQGRSLGRDFLYLLQTPFALSSLIFTRFQVVLIRLGVDCLIIAAVTYVAYLERFGGGVSADFLSAGSIVTLLYGLPLVVASYAIAFVATRTHRGIWRYVGVEDFWRLLGACGLGGVIAAALLYLLRSPFPRSVLLLTAVLAVMVLGGTRLAVRSIMAGSERLPPIRERRRVIILGAGSAGQSVAREILRTRPLGYEVAGFVDDDPRLRGAILHNLPVLGMTMHLDQLARTHRLDEAIVAIPRLGLADLRRIGESCARAGLEFKTMPSVEQLIRGEGSLRYLRKVDLDELLRRAPLSLDPSRVAAFVRDKRVAVTGAGGSIGSELCRQLTALGAGALLMIDRAENALFDIGSELETRPSTTRLTAALGDVKHVPRMAELFDHFRPDIVFHTAAYKQVPLVECHPIEAVLNNVVGTVRFARLARAHGTGVFTLVSTDAGVKPTNVVSATKRICEMYMIAMNARQRALSENAPQPRFRVVRLGRSALSSSSSALPLFQRHIENGTAVAITHPEISRFFTTIQEAVALLLESAMLETTADALVLNMGETVTIAEPANDLVGAETLWDEADQVEQSGHPRLLALRQRVRPLAELDELVAEIERLALEGHVEQVLTRVSHLVPSYVPSYESSRPGIMKLARRWTHAHVDAASVTRLAASRP